MHFEEEFNDEALRSELHALGLGLRNDEDFAPVNLRFHESLLDGNSGNQRHLELPAEPSYLFDDLMPLDEGTLLEDTRLALLEARDARDRMHAHIDEIFSNKSNSLPSYKAKLPRRNIEPAILEEAGPSYVEHIRPDDDEKENSESSLTPEDQRIAEKEFLRRNHLRAINCPAPGRLPFQHDHLKKHEFYKKLWNKFRTPGEEKRLNLRWCVRDCLMNREIPFIRMERTDAHNLPVKRPEWVD